MLKMLKNVLKCTINNTKCEHCSHQKGCTGLHRCITRGNWYGRLFLLRLVCTTDKKGKYQQVVRFPKSHEIPGKYHYSCYFIVCSFLTYKVFIQTLF